jgi:hypothetical protein
VSPEEQAMADLVRQIIEPRLRIISELVGDLLRLIKDQGTPKMKADALVISQRFASRIAEFSA